MAKTKISEYSATAGSNTDINNINLAEGMAPSLVNNAIRQLMAQLKDFQVGTAGDNVTVGGNLAVTGTSAFTGAISAPMTAGTIDGVPIGGTTTAAGAFTTLAASGTTTLAGALVGSVTQAAFNTVSTTLNLGGAATAVNIGAATGTATVANTTLAAKAITASTTLAVTGTSTLTGAVTATAGVTGPITSSSATITGGSITGITDLAVADGGTGASTAAGGLNNLLPSQTSAANKYLQSDGTNASWDAITVSTSDITGTLAVTNGGTGQTSYTDGQLLIGNSTGNTLTKASLTAGSGVTITPGAGSIQIAFTGPGAGSVTSTSVVSANGFAGTVATATSTPAITLSTSVTGVIKGDGTAISAATAGTDYLAPPSGTAILKANSGGALANATAGTDYVAPGTATTFTATQTFTGTSSATAIVLNDAAEVATVSATAATGTINYDITTQSVLYYTSNASANWTVNFRASSGTSLDTLMSTGQSMTVAFLVTQGATAYYNSAVQVDGTTSGVTTRWLGGAPTAGNASGIDSYRYLIIKTGSATFTVLASNTQFKA